MRKLAWIAATSTVVALIAVLVAHLLGGQGAFAQGNVAFDIDPETTGNSANTLGTVEDCARVDIASPAFDGVDDDSDGSVNDGCPALGPAEATCTGAVDEDADGHVNDGCPAVGAAETACDTGSDYNIDIVVFGDTLAPQTYDSSLNYDSTKVHVAAPGTDAAIKLSGSFCLTDRLPDSDGTFAAGCAYLSGGPGTAGNGTITRVGLDIGAAGLVTFSLDDPPQTAYASGMPDSPVYHPITLDGGMLAINQDCPGVTPTPTPGTPTATSTSTPLPTPPPGTIMLVSGWNNPCYVGPEQRIEDALADVADHVLAVYRMRADQGFDTWFSNRPEASNITTVSPYQPLFILMGQYAFWPHEPSGTPPPSGSLARGWNNVCYTGQTKSVEDATAGVAGGLVIMYQLGSDQGWRYFVPARPEIGSIEQLSQYDTVLMLVNQEGGTTWTFDP